jgi:hypothetical protein
VPFTQDDEQQVPPTHMLTAVMQFAHALEARLGPLLQAPMVVVPGGQLRTGLYPRVEALEQSFTAVYPLPQDAG